MSILDTTIVNVALNTLSRDLHSTIDSIQWVATGYLLALAAVIPLTALAIVPCIVLVRAERAARRAQAAAVEMPEEALAEALAA